MIVVLFFGVAEESRAAVLNPAVPVTTCGEMAVGGTYTLGADFDGAHGYASTTECFIISASGVEIDPNGHTLTANITLKDTGGGSPVRGGDDTLWPGDRTWVFKDSSELQGTIKGSAYFFSNAVVGGTVGRVFYIGANDGKIWTNSAGDGNWSNAVNWIGGIPNGEDIAVVSSITLPGNTTSNLYISANDVVVDGGGFELTGDIRGSGDSRVSNHNSKNIALQNVHLNGSVYAIGVSADDYPGHAGNISVTNSYITGGLSSTGGDLTSDIHGPGSGGIGGDITVASSTVIDAITSSGGNSLGVDNGSAAGNIIITNSVTRGSVISSVVGSIGGLAQEGGSITISGTSLDLSDTLISANGGTVDVSYTTIDHTNTALSALTSLTINGSNKGPFAGGSWPVYITAGTITECGYLIEPGVYTLGSNVTGDCVATADGVTIDGGSNNYTLNGTVSTIASTTATSTLTLSNIVITGAITSVGSMGDVSIINASTSAVSSDGKVTVDEASRVGDIIAGGDVTILNGSVAGDVSVVGASGEGETEESGSGTSGNILIDNSTTGALAVSGAGGEEESSGGSAGSITVRNNSNSGVISSVGGTVFVTTNSTVGDIGSGGGAITIHTATAGNITSEGGSVTITSSGVGDVLTDINGSRGGSVSITESTAGNISANGYTTSGVVGGGVVYISHSTIGNVLANSIYNCSLGGSITIVNSTSTGNTLEANGDVNGSDCGGNGGSITITGTQLDIRGMTIEAQSFTGDTHGTLALNYTGLMTSTTTVFSALSDLVLNGISVGPFSGGIYNPTIYYYNNAVGDGDWGNLLNWWTSPDFTGDHPSSLPTSVDQVFVYGNVTQDTSGTAVAGAVTFTGTTTNAIQITTNNAVFTDSSSNQGTIVGNATFEGDDSDNNGVVRGAVASTIAFNWTKQDSAGQRAWASVASSASGTKAIAADSNGYIYTSADSGVTWTARTNAGQRAWASVTSSSDGTKLAAAAYNDYIYTSADSGVTWTARTNAGQRAWASVTSSSDGTKLAAAANNDYIYTSINSGANWTQRTSAGQRDWTSVTSSSDGTKLAALGSLTYIYTSTDSGVSWEEGTSLGQANWGSITSSSDGAKLAVADSSGYIYTSIDSGATWTPHIDAGARQWGTIASSANGEILFVVDYNNGNGHIYVSTNSGAEWTAQTEMGDYAWSAIAASADGYVSYAVSSNGGSYTNSGFLYTGQVSRNQSSLVRLFTSSVATIRNFLTEGARNDWIIISQGVNTIVDLANATYDLATNVFKSVLGGLFSASQTNYTDIPAGVNWVARTSAGVKQWRAVASSADGTKLAAVNNSGYIYTSTDSGETWTEQTNSGQRYWQSIASSADGSKLAAVNNSGYIYTSTDSGATWTEQTNSGQRNWYSITSSSDGTKLAAVNREGYIYTSTDSGATWTGQANSGNHAWQSITSSADGTKLAASGSNSYIYTSTDSGETWTEQTNSGQRYWQSIASSADGSKLAVAADYVYTSADSGATWTRQTGSGQRAWQSMASSADGTKLAVTTNPGYIYTSTDSGATWTRQTNSGERHWQKIASSEDGLKLVAIVDNDYIYTSAALQGYAVDVVPTLTVYSPINQDVGNTTKWAPNIDFGTSTTRCEYAIDTTTYSQINCTQGGSDIPRPTNGQHTFYVRATDSHGGIAENHFNFVYDNTAPVDTDCSTPLDESTRPYYYLTGGVVTGDCHIAIDTELRGSLSGTGILNGSVISDSTSTRGHNVTLRNITVTGSVNTSGIVSGSKGGNISAYNSTIGSLVANGMAGTNGGNAGSITVATSTTGSVTANGGAGNINGGNGGTISIVNTNGSDVNTPVISNGGSSALCGKGGNAGNVTITNADNYVVTNNTGTGGTCASSSSGRSGERTVVTRAQYSASQSNSNSVTGSPSTPPATRNAATRAASAPVVKYTDNAIHGVSLDINMVSKLDFKPLPTFGDGKDAFSLKNPVSSFVLSPLPESITSALKKAPELAKLISSSGITKEQDLVKIAAKPLLLPKVSEDELPNGLFSITVGASTSSLASYLTAESKDSISQLVEVEAGSIITVSLVPTGKVTASSTFMGKDIAFVADVQSKKISVTLQIPQNAGSYRLTTSASPIPLIIKVPQKASFTAPIQGTVKKIFSWISKIFR